MSSSENKAILFNFSHVSSVHCFGNVQYHMTLREGFAQTPRVPSYGRRWFGQIVI